MLKIYILLLLFIYYSYQLELCQSDKLVVYKLILHTFWSRDRFPKHYPDWKPVAQWSKVIGRSHNANYTLFRLGTKANIGVKNFAESGQVDQLVNDLLRNKDYVLDDFFASGIRSGVGRTVTEFFTSSNFSKISIMSRIVPSPDWFIGVDSFDLCLNGNWLDSVTLELDPLDAGTDNGFTFTAQNWATEPQGIIYRIRARYPAHPAGSFYYPTKIRLPNIATVQFIKLSEYNLLKTFKHGRDNKQYEIIADFESDRQPDYAYSRNADLQKAIEEEREELDRNRLVIKDNKSAILNSIKNSYFMGAKNELVDRNVVVVPLQKQKKKNNRRNRIVRDCKVSDWGEWSVCNRTCGIGEMVRRRRVLKKERHGGKPCPPLRETKWCGSWDSCPSLSKHQIPKF